MRPNPQDPKDVERAALALKKKYPLLSIHQRRVVASIQLWFGITGDARFALVGFDAKNRPVLSKPEYGEVRYWAVLRNGDPTDAPSMAPAGVTPELA